MKIYDNDYSTRRNLTEVEPNIQNVSNTKFESVLFLPPNPKRIAEGGFRLEGEFKASNTNKKPLITVLTVVFNGAKTIEDTILSVIKQTYDNVELIIIDGGSTDNTLDIVRKYEHVIDYWISEPDQGIYEAFNKAISCSTGSWLYFLGSDDFLWTDSVLANLALEFQTISPNLKLLYGNVAIVNSNKKLIYKAGEPWDMTKQKLRTVMSVPHQGLFYRRSWFEQFGLYDTTYKIAGDYENLLRGQPKEDAAYIPDLIVAGMSHGGISSTPENSIKSLKEVINARRIHGAKYPNLKLLFAFFRVYIRYGLKTILGERLTYKFIDFGRNLFGMPSYWTKL